jgi:hypothetical protein
MTGLVILGVVAMVGVGAGLAYWRMGPGCKHGHAALFRGLCGVHGLDGASRRLLRQIGQHHGVNPLARLFIEPRWLEPKPLEPAFADRREQLAVLREHLFGGAKQA